MSEEAPLLDLSTFDFRPDWAKDQGGAAPAKHPEPREYREHHGPRPPKPKRGGFRNDRPGGRRDQRDQRGPKHGKPFHGPRHNERPAPPPNPFPWLRIAFTATPAAVETVVQQVRHTGKTFSLFEIARILLRNPASYTIELTSAPKQPEGPFHLVGDDGSVWLSREAAVQHILRRKLGEFYRVETVDVEPPKGNFPVVAVCGMSGTIIGPPNHHEFERRLRELHREKFPRMDFETFRSRLKMDRDPAMIEKWRTEASKAVEYYPLEGEAPEKLADLAAVERHFAATRADSLIKLAEVGPVPGDARKAPVDPALAPLLGHAREEEARFPLRLAQSLSRALSAAGLRFHKAANRTTFVSASRPRHLNLEETPVSDSIRKILGIIREKKLIRRTQLLDLLAPKAPAAAAAAAPATTETPTPEAAPAAVEDPARTAALQDLLWLTHEGYVIEYADTRLESVPPPKNPPKPAAATPAAENPVTAAEVAPVVEEAQPVAQDEAPSESPDA